MQASQDFLHPSVLEGYRYRIHQFHPNFNFLKRVELNFWDCITSNNLDDYKSFQQNNDDKTIELSIWKYCNIFRDSNILCINKYRSE